MSSRPRDDENRSKKHQWVWLVLKVLLITAVLAAVDLMVRLALPSFDSSIWGPSLRRFLTSPGAGGAAAIIAATIGASALYVQLRHTRFKDKNQAWWSTFEWATERAVPSKQDNNAVPISLSVNVLNSLQESANDTLQLRACGGFVDHIVAQAESEEPASSDSSQPLLQKPATGETEADMQLDAFSSYVQATAKTKAASLLAEIYVEEQRYKKQVLEALNELKGLNKIVLPDDDHLLPGGTYVNQHDAVCEIAGEEVIICVLGGTASAQTKVKARAKKSLKDHTELGLPLLFISPAHDLLNEIDTHDTIASSTTWTAQAGSIVLEKAIQNAAKLAQEL